MRCAGHTDNTSADPHLYLGGSDPLKLRLSALAWCTRKPESAAKLPFVDLAQCAVWLHLMVVSGQQFTAVTRYSGVLK